MNITFLFGYTYVLIVVLFIGITISDEMSFKNPKYGAAIISSVLWPLTIVNILMVVFFDVALIDVYSRVKSRVLSG